MSKRVCKICGRTYEYCPTCYRDSFKPRYMISFDDEPCKKLWDICCAHGAGQITSKEALSKLEEIKYKELMIENKEILAHIAKIEKEAVNPVADEISVPSDVKKDDAEAVKPVKAKSVKPLYFEGDTVTLAINNAKEFMRKQM